MSFEILLLCDAVTSHSTQQQIPTNIYGDPFVVGRSVLVFGMHWIVDEYEIGRKSASKKSEQYKKLVKVA